MAISFVEKSKYFRGLLVVIRRDQVIDIRERDFVLEFGKVLDFDARFCEASVDDLLKNPHITDEPVLFEDRAVAASFVRDGVRLAMIDDGPHPKEMKWLRAVAQANGLHDRTADAEVRRCRRRRTVQGGFPPFAIRRHLA